MNIQTKDFAKEMIRVANLAVENGEMTSRKAACILEASAELITNSAFYRDMVKEQASSLRRAAIANARCRLGLAPSAWTIKK